MATDEGDKRYFIVETKSSLLVDDPRLAEAARAICGVEHFEVLMLGENPARQGKLEDVAGPRTALLAGPRAFSKR